MNSSSTEDVAARRRTIYGATGALLLLVCLSLNGRTWQGSHQLHTLMELTATLVALIVGILSLVRFYSKKENTFLFIATGFIGTGFLDGYHAIVSAPVFKQYFPSPPPSLIPWSGFASRLFLSVLLWLSWAFWRREARLGKSGRVPESIVYLIVGTWTLACFCLFAFAPLPVGYEAVPLFHRPQEFLPAFFFLLALTGYLRKGRWKSDPFEHWLALSIILCVGQSVLISTSDKLFDAMYIASHVVKLLSYIFTFAGLVVAMYYLFLAEESAIDERTKELQIEIAERKRAEEESLALLHREQRSLAKVREEKAFSEAVIQGLPALVCLFDDAGTFLRWNTRFETMLGYSAAEVAQIKALDTVAEEHKELVQQTMQQVFEHGSAETEVSLLTEKGDKVPCYLSGVRIVVDNKPCLLGAAIDIGKRKLAEDQVRLQATALESVANGIVVTDAVGTIQWVNPAFTRLTGYTLKDAVGKNPRILKSGIHDASFYKELWNTIVAGRIWKGEITNRKKDGQLYIEELTIAPVWSAAGEITNFVAIKQDSTERKRAQAELVKAKEVAEAASRVKSEFLANMSHELRTPMNGIMGMTELALDTDLTSEQREYLSMVKTSADSLLTLINDILDFSKIEAGKLEFESIEFNLRGSLKTAVKVLALRAHEKGLELNCRVRPEVPEAVVGDPSRLRQIIVNLVGNAVKFTEKGEVTVDVQLESEEPASVVLHFSVTDTGIGIPAERREVIFDAFAQADGSTTRRYGGTGLGLTVSKRLVGMFGGRLWLESVVGQGSAFHFTIHLGVGNRCGWAVPLVSANLEGLAVLVVDDNLTNRRILEELLAGWRMKPILAEQASTALEHLKQAADAGKPLPLILVDSKMPEVDGFAFVEQLKQDPRLAPATIMMTSAGQRGDAARCRELGVAAYLTKPIGQSELLNAILQVLGAKPEKTDQTSMLVTRHSLRERSKGLHILLAEDNLVNRTVVVRLLAKHGHMVETATDGREALGKLKSGNFDLVLMDVQMPELDGFEATAAIRDLEKTKGGHLPIIAMTAHALKGDRERCLAAGMDGYLSKPFRVEELLKEIESLPQL